MPRLTSMGVRVSPEARSALLRIKDRARKISGAQTMEKYSAPSRRISGSAFSQPGRCGAIHWVSSVSSAPEISAIQTACMAALRAVRSSFAPTARATQASTPMPSAHRGELVSHVTVVVRPTAAVACTPSRPTSGRVGVLHARFAAPAPAWPARPAPPRWPAAGASIDCSRWFLRS